MYGCVVYILNTTTGNRSIIVKVRKNVRNYFEFFFAIMIRPVSSKYYMTEEEVKAVKAALEDKVAKAQASGVVPPAKPTSAGTLVICWLIVGIPLVWGVYQVALQTAKMFA